MPYPEPIKVAQCLDAKRLNKQIIECRQILDAIDGTGKGWFNHPVVNMYKSHRDWLFYYMNCLDCYQKGLINYAQDWDEWANEKKPLFLTSDLCDQHKRRLYTKNPEHYKQFAEYGRSDENWYFVDGKIVKYINGKLIKE